ncbi:uncharacterized protein LOC143466099 [Clavelina lepadiformis]|uniref:Uncharacterized protein n=1 Tax=Clavelina lepadiformis TaxID=159417 RepID=A0ABP0EXB4_CLALP
MKFCVLILLACIAGCYSFPCSYTPQVVPHTTIDCQQVFDEIKKCINIPAVKCVTAQPVHFASCITPVQHTPVQLASCVTPVKVSNCFYHHVYSTPVVSAIHC